MLQFVFGCLLALNAGLLGYQLGWFDALVAGGHEPQRLKNQINADKVRLLSPRQPVATERPLAPAPPEPEPAVSATPSSTPVQPPGRTSAPSTPAPLRIVDVPISSVGASATQDRARACVEVGNLTLAEARRFEARLAALALAEKPVQREVREESSHMVWIPPTPNGKEGADRKVVELRTLGVREYFVLQDDPERRYGISLGVFKTEEAAQARLARLIQQGVRSARVTEHKIPFVRAAFQIAGMDGQARLALDRIKNDFPRLEEKQCGA